MKNLIIILMVFGSFQALSKDCDKTNYRDFVFNEKAMDKLTEKYKGCDLYRANFKGFSLKGFDLRMAELSGANLSKAKFK